MKIILELRWKIPRTLYLSITHSVLAILSVTKNPQLTNVCTQIPCLNRRTTFWIRRNLLINLTSLSGYCCLPRSPTLQASRWINEICTSSTVNSTRQSFPIRKLGSFGYPRYLLERPSRPNTERSARSWVWKQQNRGLTMNDYNFSHI